MKCDKSDSQLELESFIASLGNLVEAFSEEEKCKNIQEKVTKQKFTESKTFSCPKRNEKLTKVKPDKRLVLWEKYINERRELCQKISDKVDRQQDQLIMNTIDYFRPKVEDEILFDYTSILDPPDSERGSPSFWQIPVHIIPKHPELEAEPDSHQKCQIPVREFVAVPNVIKEEKGTTGRPNKMIKQWYNMPYRRKRRSELLNRINYIEPHKPDLDELVIIGEKISKEKPVKIETCIPEIMTTLSEYECKCVDQCRCKRRLKQHVDTDLGILILKIHDIVIDKRLKYLIKPRIRVTFSCTATDTQIHQASVPITNQGTVTLICNWKRICSNLKKELCKETFTSHFIFPTNNFTILPGQTQMFTFLFQAKQVGIIKESWQLVTDPVIVAKNVKIVFYLRAVVTEPRCDLTRINNLVMNSLQQSSCPQNVEEAHDLIIFDQLIQMKEHEAPLIEGRVLREHLFYLANFDQATGRPKYSYQKSIVDTLEDVYSTYNFLQPWDLRIESVIEVLERQNSKELLQQINSLIDTIKYVPTEEINPEFYKRFMVYKILCSTIDLIVEDAIKLAKFFEMSPRKDIYPEFDENENISYQYKHLFEDNSKILYVSNVSEPLTRCFRRSDYRNADRDEGEQPPRMYQSRLPDIYELNAVERFNKYKEIKAKTVEKKEELLKLPKGEKISKKEVAKLKSIVIENQLGQETELVQQTESVQDPETLEHFRETLHIKVYFHLLDAIDDITAIIESCNTAVRQPSLKALQRILECQNSTLDLDENTSSDNNF